MKFILNKLILGTALSVFAFGTASVQAQSANFTGSYAQNFDSALGTAGTALPPGFISMVIAGANSTYTAATPIDAAGIASATADTQTLLIWNVGTAVTKSGTQSYNIGCWDSLNDRALGTDPTGTAAQVIQLALTNTTGSTLYGVTFNYDCKCMTNGSVGTEESELPGYCFFYSTTGTGSAGNWSEVGVAGNVPGATNSSGVPIANGLCLPNFTQGTTMSSGPVNITFATPLTNNGVMYFRWADDNNEANSPDQMLAIDDISVATYTPAGPSVSITSPASGSTVGGGTITLQASVNDLTGTVTNVSYYSGATFLGEATIPPYSFSWANVQAGSYSLAAQAEDNNGLSAISGITSLTVTNPLTASFTGVYTQNFDAALANNSTIPPAGFSAMYLPGSHFTYTNAPGELLDSNAIVTATVGSGAGSLIVWNVGSPVTDASFQLFNIGCWDGLSDRALGTDPTGTGASVIQLALTNNTGASLAGVVFSYTEKCLTNGSTSNGSFTNDGTERLELPGYEFFYSVTGDTNATNWFMVPVLSATNWIQDTVSNAGPVTLMFPQLLPNGGVMYFRWADDNCVASSPDQMYGIDNISITSFNPNGPQVSFVSPTNNENVIPGTAFTVSINATDNTSTISNVTLYLDGSPVYTFNSAPYILPVPGGELPAGSYTVTAVATDNSGLSATSAVVNLTVAFVPPAVTLTNPASGSSYPAPADITLSASASSADGSITNVAFYAGTTLLANITTAPYNYNWENVSAGTYALTALAADSHGLVSTSSVVSIAVTNSFGLPVVNITSPLNNTTFTPGSNIPIAATATENGGTITNVEFYANGTDLGGSATSSYGITWPNVSLGTYVLIAVAADASGNMATSPVVNVTVSTQILPPAVSLVSPTNNAVLDVSTGLLFSATASPGSAAVTNVSFYLNTFLMASVASAPYSFSLSNAPTGDYTLTAVATDNNGLSTTSTVVNVTANNSIVLATLKQIKTVFIIPLENHDFVQANPEGSPQQLLGNPACPYFNSLITPGNSNAIQTAYATHYFSCAIGGEHPSEPNYLWAEAGTDFGIRTDDDPSTSVGNLFSNVKHLSGQLTAAGVSWNDYQEDVQYSSSEEVSASGSGVPVNPYNGTTEYNYAVKHNPMAFYTDTTNRNIYPMTNLWNDLASNTVAKYNWITPDQYNEMHSSLPGGYTYNGVAYTGDQAAIAEGDNALSIIIPKIMASKAYQDNGVIIIWTDETESTDDTNTTLPYIIISSLTKGNAYASTLAYSHSSDLKTMDELFGLTYQTNAIPNGWIDAQNTGYNYVNGSSAIINDLSDFFVPVSVQPTVSLLAPTNNAVLDVATGLVLSATASSSVTTITNVAFYLNTFLIGDVTSAPYMLDLTNVPTGDYTLTAIATDNNGLTATSSVVNVTIYNSIALATLHQIKTVFVIPLENHDFVQANPEGSPEQLLGNPACPYFNSLITPGNSNAVQTAYATHYFSCAIGGEHPSEPNYLWAEAGTDFGIRTDNDPSASSHNIFTNVMHLSGQLTTAGIAWSNFQEDVQYSSSEEVSASGSGVAVNPYNGTTEYNYAVKHNPMAFYPDTQNKNIYPMTNLLADLQNNTLGRYNWITPDQYNEMHSSLPSGYTYHGVAYTGDQAAIAEGDNALSIIVPQIMASKAYQDNGVIIIWTDETESTDDTNTTLPYVIISPLAKGNAYASTLAYSHSSDLKTMDELFGLAYQTNAIPNGWVDAQNTGYNYVNGSSAIINDLSDFFQTAHAPPVANPVSYTRTANLPLLIPITNLLSNVTSIYGDPITLVGVGTDGMNLLTTNGTTLVNNGSYILYTNSVTPNANDSFEYTVSDGQGGTNVGTVSIVINNNLFGQTSPQLAVGSTNVTATFFGIPGYSYIVDRSTNLMVGAGWVPISTNTAPASGVIQIIDNFQGLGVTIPPLPSPVFYRLQYNP
jgi:hypothetical protein